MTIEYFGIYSIFSATNLRERLLEATSYLVHMWFTVPPLRSVLWFPNYLANICRVSVSVLAQAVDGEMRIGSKLLGGAQSYLKSSLESRKYKEVFESINSYCMFIGYPMSGHSLIGSLLDAHRHMLIAHELDALAYVEAGFSKNQLFYLLLERSREFTESGRKWMGYTYVVPNQWQGKFDELKVIGDKKGGRSTLRLGSNPQLLQRLRQTVSVNVKFIHITRNPYDNITTIGKKSDQVHKDKFENLGKDLGSAIDYFFYLCDINKDIIRQISSKDLFECKYESFISEPRRYLSELCEFLGVEVEEDYLVDCAGTIFKSPHKSRFDIEWDPKSIDIVNNKMKDFDFLSGYSFDS